MGIVGACGDNAAMESFFSLLQKNVLDRQPWSTQEQLRLAIVTWIEKTYHRKRRQRRLGKLTPFELETIKVRDNQSDRIRGLKTINPTSQPKWGSPVCAISMGSPQTAQWITLAERASP
jgi:putative transposase